MKFFQKKAVAIAVFVLLVLSSVLFGSNRSLNSLRNKALNVYVNGDSTGLSISANLNSITEYTSSLLKTAGAYYDSDNEVYAGIRTCYNALLDAGKTDVAAHRAALTELLSDCTLLQTDYQTRTDIPQSAVKTMNRCINDMISMKDQIAHSAYNEKAASFNEILAAFPADFLGALSGVRALPLF